MKLLKIFLLVVWTTTLLPQDLSVSKVEPPNWWAGMRNNKIQLMVYGKELKDAKVSFNTKNIKVVKVHKTENSDYLFIDIEISKNIKPADYTLKLNKGEINKEIIFPILNRINDKSLYKGFGPEDVVYLIVPDRFVNGDQANDNVDGMIDTLRPLLSYGRHGGDLKGIISKLDYLKDLGVTAIWNTPLVENNQHVSYHGYAGTNFYKIDPRFGDNELYKTFVNEAHKRGLKVILDHVANHLGIRHEWINSYPTSDWFNGTHTNHLPAEHTKVVLRDVHSDSTTMKRVTNGWFVDEMPDINQRNPYVAKYIIQNTIWWIEYAGIDGIREDTYPYNDIKFMSTWAKEIYKEYPDFSLLGEVWSGDAAFLAPYQKNSIVRFKEFDSELTSVTDFELRDALQKYFSGKEGLYGIFETITKDYLYPNPEMLLTFLDNHDIGRVNYYAKGNLNKVKNSIFLLLTLRGIPQMLYATEIGMEGTEDHGYLRGNFPGGFPMDTINAFTDQGRNNNEKEIFNFTKNLLNLRKEHKGIATGKMIHYPLENNVYVYFRVDKDKKYMCMVNGEDKKKEIGLKNFIESLQNVKTLTNLMTGEKINYSSDLKINFNTEEAIIFSLD